MPHFEHLFSSIKGLAIFGDEDKRGIVRKLNLFLKFVSKIVERENKKLIKISEEEDNHFIITIKKTDNFVSRMERIQEKLNEEIDNERLQNRLTDFF